MEDFMECYQKKCVPSVNNHGKTNERSLIAINVPRGTKLNYVDLIRWIILTNL
jgi:hypothetical protein